MRPLSCLALFAAALCLVAGFGAMTHPAPVKPEARLTCSTDMDARTADFSDMYDIDAKESVRLYCRIGR